MVLTEPTLVGREKELEELQRCLDLAVEGKGKTIFVSGEAGSGKTRLINEFLSKASKKGITLLYGWCLSDAAVPYFPFVEAFRTYFSTNEEAPTEDQRALSLQPPAKLESASIEGYGITTWLSRLSHTVKPGTVASASPQVWKDQLFAAIAETLHSVSSKQPVVILIEDAHWADSASLALLHYVARVTSSEKILVLATFRSEELTTDAEGRPNQLTEMIRLMKREEILTEIKLPNLTQTEVAKLAENMVGGNLQAKFAEKLAKESRGNPLFIVESLRMFSESKSLVTQDSEWLLVTDELGIPSRVRDIILRRLANLKYMQRRVLDAASVIGEEFNIELLSTLLGQDSLDIIETLNLIAQSTSIVRVEGDSYRFDHSKSREVLYETLSLPLRRAYHGRIAEKLELQSKNNKLLLADLAYHYAQAENENKAVEYSLAAGQEELARWSNTEAAKHFQYVLEKTSDKPERFSLRTIALEGLGDAYYASDNFKQATNIFDQLADLQSGADKLRALRKAMFAAWFLGDITLLVRLTQQAEENATADRLESGRVLHQKARVFAMKGDTATCLRISEEALQIFEEEYALADAAWILFTIGANRRVLGHEIGISAALRSIALYDGLNDIRSQLEAYLYLGIAYTLWGLFEEGKRTYEKVIDLDEQLRMADYIRLIPAYSFFSLGLLREAFYSPNSQREVILDAISKALKALEYAKKTDSNLYIGQIYELLVIEHAFIDDSVHMEEYFGELMALPENVLSNTFSKSHLQTAKGVYYAAKNEFERANEYFSKLFQSETINSTTSFLLHKRIFTWVLAKQGRLDEAESQLEQIRSVLKRLREEFSHVNVQSSLMTFTHPEVNQTFEMRLDLANVSRSQGYIAKVEKLLIPGLTITEVSPNCLVRDETVEFKDKSINPFEVKTIKLTVKATKPEIFQLQPTVTYVDDLGETKTSSTRAFTITVQPAMPAYEALTGRIATGTKELDRLLPGGIPQEYAVILAAHSTDEREQLTKNFLETGALAGETTFHITSEAANTKKLAEKYPLNFYLFLCNPQADTLLQNAPNVYKLKGVENLTEIDIALTKALRKIDSSSAGPRRFCVSIVSEVLLQHHALVTRKWFSALLPTLKSKGFTILAVIDPQIHPPEELQSIIGIFDGEIRVTEKETPEGVRQMLRIRKLLNQKYLDKEIVLTKEKLS